MTYEEAKELLKTDSCYECAYGTDNSAVNCTSECIVKDAIIKAIEALEKADKYRWHDLRKNPEDLPNKSADVLTYIECENGKWNEVCHYEEHGFYNGITGEDATFVVAAWREIEPFEVTE